MSTRPIPQLEGYHLVRPIGRGAGAVISLAQRRDGQQVAIKHVVRREPEDEKYIAQAENEFAVARQFEHPYLRRCYELVRVRKWMKTRELYLIMEYVDGDTLEHQRPTELAEIVGIFLQVAEGLQALHRLGFAHADMKPNNIVLVRDGSLKIIDFGQSCPLGCVKTRVQGTPDYMAPEQVQRKEIDQRTDVFNLGATMYWVVTGRAFRTIMPTSPSITGKIPLESQRGNEPPHELKPELPLSLSRLIMECCETRRESRPPDMRAVISRLDLVLHLLAKRRRRHAQLAPPPD